MLVAPAGRCELVTVVMPKYSRTRSGETGAGADTENGTQYPVQVYSEVNTRLAIDASGISGGLAPHSEPEPM